jgi:TetR/AcrR family transcriptional regulator
MPGARGSDTRERVLRVAEKQFAQKGYEGAHLESIAREVGVRKTALYYYFDSKAALYTAVLEQMLQAFERRMWDAMRQDLSHVEKAKQIADHLHDLLAENPNYSRILIRVLVNRIDIDDSNISPIIERIVGAALTFFHEGVKAGAFRKLSSRHVFQNVIGMSIFHYAGGDFSAAVLDVEDIFEPGAVEWRREQARSMILGGILEDGSGARSAADTSSD